MQQTANSYILLDGLLRSGHNTLINIAIGRAAHQTLGLNPAYLCFTEDQNHLSDRLFQKAGIPPFELSSYAGGTPTWYKLSAKLRGYWGAMQDETAVLNLETGGLRIGDLIYDAIVRGNKGVHTLQDASFSAKRSAIEWALRQANQYRRAFQSNDIAFLVLSHKVYTRFGIPARVATDCGVTFLSKSRAHLNRVSSFDDHVENDYVLSLSEMDRVIDRVGESRLRSYVADRFEGNVDGTDVQFAFAGKTDYSAEALRTQLDASEKPLAVVSPHAFSDAPHCDREMVYHDYYQWFVRILELTKELNEIRWAVKPHPSSSLYNEEGVVEQLVQQYDHVQLVPGDVKTDSVLRAADAILTVRGTIGMEALLFDCQVILAGNAIYEAIESVDLNLSETSLLRSLRSIGPKSSVPEHDKLRALASLYYRNESYNYVSPIFGPERPPGLSKEEATAHDQRNVDRWMDFLEDHSYEDSLYYQQLTEFFRSRSNRLSIIDLIDGQCVTK